MRKNSISKILDAIIPISIEMALLFIVLLFLPKIYGIVIGIVIVAIITIIDLITKKHIIIPRMSRDCGLTLLLSIVTCIGSLVCAFVMDVKFLPLFLCFSFVGLFRTVQWVVDKKWQGKSFISILKDDFHLFPPNVDIAIIIFNLLWIVFGKDEFSEITIVINGVLLLDAIIQIIINHKACGHTQ